MAARASLSAFFLSAAACFETSTAAMPSEPRMLPSMMMVSGAAGTSKSLSSFAVSRARRSSSSVSVANLRMTHAKSSAVMPKEEVSAR